MPHQRLSLVAALVGWGAISCSPPPCASLEVPDVSGPSVEDNVNGTILVYAALRLEVQSLGGVQAAIGLPDVPPSRTLFKPGAGLDVVVSSWEPPSDGRPGEGSIDFDGRRLFDFLSLDLSQRRIETIASQSGQECQGSSGDSAVEAGISLTADEGEIVSFVGQDTVFHDEGISYLLQVIRGEKYPCRDDGCASVQALIRRLE